MGNYKSLDNLIDKVNKQIDRIEKNYGKDAWSISNMKKYLDTQNINAFTKQGRISKRQYSRQEQIELENYLNKFTNYKTSSIKGIKETEKNIKETMRTKLKNEDKTPSNREINIIYKAMEDDDVKWLQERMQRGSDIWQVISEARETTNNKLEFDEYLRQFIQWDNNDMATREKISSIYNKYIRR